MSDSIFLSGDQVPPYLRGVELMTAGMEWPAMNGPVTVTMEHIADAIVAANEDPHIQPPRIKLGHTSPLNGDHPDYDPFAAIGDAEPSFGVFTNLRAANDGAVLLGDADNVIAWLAESAPSTYPNRSAEANWDVAAADFDVQTAGGKRYSMVVTAVSLLGVYIPAIGDLEDLTTLIMDGPAALQAGQAPAAAAAAHDAALSVSTDTIRQRFNFDWAMGENDAEPDTYWWWARDVRVDDNEVIADDDEGNLWSVPFATDGADTITFGQPVEVRQTFVPVAASARVASFSRPSKPQRPPAAAGTTPAATERPNTEEVESMTDQVREFLVGQGHDPEQATAEQITAAETYCAAFPATPAPEGAAGAGAVGAEGEGETETEGAPAADTETEGASETDRQPVAAGRQIPEGAVIIDAEELARLRAGADAGTRLATEQATRDRDRVILAARDEGRFPPSRLAHYTRMFDADPEGTTVLLTADEDKGGLAKGTVPLQARAQVPDPEAAGLPASGEPLPDNVSLLNPSERAALKARRAV
jgi:hypothetical protein